MHLDILTPSSFHFLIRFIDNIGVGADGALLGLAHDGAATGRSRTLLQASRKAACPIDLATVNYTVLISRCRWPPFDPSPCYAAFKHLACPYADYFNNNSTDCAFTMFQPLIWQLPVGYLLPQLQRRPQRSQMLGHQHCNFLFTMEEVTK
jgi:hypothetical protein